MLEQPTNIPVQPLQDEVTELAGVELFIKREDLIHPYISGNKWRKLRYVLEEAQQQGCQQLLTFGGAYSNHILAVAAAAQQEGFKSVGIIRGEAHSPLNPSLAKATALGMELHYLPRSEYRHKHTEEVLLPLRKAFPEAYFIPEGGSTALALPGCAEIAEDLQWLNPTHIAVSCGTGGTLAGLIQGCSTYLPQAKLLGFPALKGGSFLEEEIHKLLQASPKKYTAHYQLLTHYHFGGYAKKKPELLNFMSNFQTTHQIPLDFVYTGKMMFGLYDLIKSGFFPKQSRIVGIHTGGLHNGALAA